MKERPNHALYIAALREMGADRRLQKAFQLSEFARALLRRGLEIAHPELEQDALAELYQARMSRARNRRD